MKKFFFCFSIIFLLFFSCSLNDSSDNVRNNYSEKFIELKNILLNQSLNDIPVEFNYDSIKDVIFYSDDKCTVNIFLDNVDYLSDFIYLKFELIDNNVKSLPYYGKVKFYIRKDASRNTGILLSFDDYFAGNWEKYLDFLSERKLFATWFCRGTLEKVRGFCLKAQDLGFEVGYHTKNHKSFKDADVTEDVVREQAVDSLPDFFSNGIEYNSFAFVGGNYKSWMIPYLLDFYKILRLFYNIPTYYRLDEIKDKKVIYSNSIDAKWLNYEEFTLHMKKRLLITKVCNYIYPCTSHYILNDKLDEHYYENGKIFDDYTITESKLNYLSELVSYFKMNTLLYKDLY